MFPNERMEKERILDEFLHVNKLDGVLLSMKDNLAWLTCGGSCWVGKDSKVGSVDILVLGEKKYLIAAVNEKNRILDEEIANHGYELVEYAWYESREDAISTIIAKHKVASDSGVLGLENLYGKIQQLRLSLMPAEIERLRELSRLVSITFTDVCRNVKRGDTEHAIAAKLTGGLMENGIQAPCCLVAADERISKYRHPIPTDNAIRNYVVASVCAEKYGLIVSMTRIVSLVSLSSDLRDRHLACVAIDANFINNTKVGASLSDIFADGVSCYKKHGYALEWTLHHQGGSAGYGARDYIADFCSSQTVKENQMFAWNPSITGTKSEDTILVKKNGFEILTETDDWPMLGVETDDLVIKRPDILVL